MSDVTRIMAQIESGDPQAAEQLLPLVYDELRRLARLMLSQENPGQTLQATASLQRCAALTRGGEHEIENMGFVRTADGNVVGGGDGPRRGKPRRR